MLQQRIPSVIIKLFRSFVDLPPEYYTQDDQDVDLVSFEEAGFIVTDTLKRFAQNKSVVRRLILEDTFFMMVRLVSVKPAEWPITSDTTEPAYMMWKRKALEFLTLVPMTAEVSQYLKSRRCLEMLIQVWSESIVKGALAANDLRDDLLGLELATYQLKVTVNARTLNRQCLSGCI